MIYCCYYSYMYSEWSHTTAEIRKNAANFVVNVEFRLFVCLFGFNVAFRHLRSDRDGACL